MRICTIIFFSSLTLDKAFLTLGKPTTKVENLTKALIHDKIAEVRDKSEKSQSRNKDKSVDSNSKSTANKRYVHILQKWVQKLVLSDHSTLDIIV